MGIFKQLHENEWTSKPEGLVKVFKNDSFLVQLYQEPNKPLRITVNRTKRKNNDWVDGITWDELMHIKRMIGFKDKCAVEVYPPDTSIVNVANMRHLWITDMPDFAWKKVKE